MSDQDTTLDDLKKLLEQFVSARDWHQFHTPKNLSMALAIEAAELMEHFQWLDSEESRDVATDRQRVAAAGEELADVVCYAVALANALGLDLATTVRDKMAKNALKYPIEQYRGRWGAGDKRPGAEQAGE